MLLSLDLLQVAWQKCESDTNNTNTTVLLEIFKGITSLACATVDGKVLDIPVVSFHDEYTQQMDASREEKKDAVFLLSDEQVAKLLVPLALDMVAEIQQKDYAETASMAVIASLTRLGGALKKTQVRHRTNRGDHNGAFSTLSSASSTTVLTHCPSLSHTQTDPSRCDRQGRRLTASWLTADLLSAAWRRHGAEHALASGCRRALLPKGAALTIDS